MHTLTHIHNRNATATFNPETQKVSIRVGSILNTRIDAHPPRNITQNYEQLITLIQQGRAEVINNGSAVRVLEDFPPQSPSAASVMAAGKPGSGWLLWKFKDNGQLLDSLRKAEAQPREPQVRQQGYPARTNLANFPEINYQYSKMPPLARQRFTVDAMRTNMDRAGYGRYLKHIPQNPNGADMQAFEQHIVETLKNVLQAPARIRGAHEEIFHWIQLWGGVSGRNIYVQGGGFAQNFNLKAYQNLLIQIPQIDSIESFDDAIPRLVRECNTIGQFGPSFATKHFNFISRAAKDSLQLPIYDSVLSKGLYEGRMPDWDMYPQYVREMHNFANLQNITVPILERILFNHFGA